MERSSTGMVVGIDLGGTHFRVCLADAEGRIVSQLKRLTQAEDGPQAVVDRMATAVQELVSPLSLSSIAAIGVGAPGPLDPWQGLILQAPNLPGWKDMPLRDLLFRSLGRPVYLGNDANLAALGEARFGAGRGHRHIVYITVSTGVGSGVIVDGRLLLGGRGLAAELGHMILEPDGPLCGCGNIGCLESLASGTAIARAAKERLRGGERSQLTQLSGGDWSQIDAKMVEQAARGGDALARSVFAEAAAYLGIGIVNVLHLFDPDVVIIGGGVSRAGDLLFGPVREAVQSRAMEPYRERVRIVTPDLGDDAGLYGAVALALSQVDA